MAMLHVNLLSKSTQEFLAIFGNFFLLRLHSLLVISDPSWKSFAAAKHSTISLGIVLNIIFCSPLWICAFGPSLPDDAEETSARPRVG